MGEETSEGAGEETGEETEMRTGSETTGRGGISSPFVHPLHSHSGTHRIYMYLQYNYFIYYFSFPNEPVRPVTDGLQTSLNYNWFRPVLEPQKTDQNRAEPVYDGSVRFFSAF